MLEEQIYNILPEEISDETAYNLVNFVVELGLLLEGKYFSQIRRYYKDRIELPLPEIIKGQ